MLISNLYNFTAVWLIDRNAAVAHDEKTFFIVDLKEGNTSLVVDGCQMLSVREDRDVLRVITGLLLLTSIILRGKMGNYLIHLLKFSSNYLSQT